MPYTNTWDPLTPDGSEDANTIDNIIKALKLDVQERMEDAFVEDWTADPLVLKADVTGEASDLECWIPFSEFKGFSGNDPGFSASAPTFYQDNSTAYAFNIPIPRGAVINEMRVVARIPSTGGVVCRLYTIDDDSTDALWTQQASMNLAANANNLFNKYTSAALAITVAGFCMGVIYTVVTGDRFLGAVIKYDRSSHQLG